MGLDLNTEQEHVRIDELEIPFFREFYGQYVKKASEVKKAGRIIAPVYSIMERKANSPKTDWINNYFYSGDAFVYPAKGPYHRRSFKINLNSQELSQMNMNNELTQMNMNNELTAGGLIILSYEQADGREFNDNDAILERSLKESEVSEHPVWLELFRGNRELLGQVAQKIFRAGKDTYGYRTMMGIYIEDELAKPHLRAAYAGRLEDRSQLIGRSWLVDGDGRLVGAAPEALNATGSIILQPSLEQVLQITNEQLGNGRLELKTK